MGQSSSSQRDAGSASRHHSRRFLRPIDGSLDALPSEHRVRNVHQPQSPYATASSHVLNPPRPVSTFSRQISSQSISRTIEGRGEAIDAPTQGDAFYQGHITHISASPMPRRSRLARLSLTLNYRHIRDRLRENDETSTSRASLNPTSFGPPNPISRLGRPRTTTPIPRNYPLYTDSGSPELEEGASLPGADATNHRLPVTPNRRASGSFAGFLSRPMSRFRHSITSPLDILSPSSRQLVNSEHNDVSFAALARRSTDEVSFQLPPGLLADGLGDVSNVELSRREPTTPPPGLGVLPESADTADTSDTIDVARERRPWLPSLNLTRNLDRRESRWTTNPLRRSSSQIVHHGDESLSQVLTATAMAIATQISTNNGSATTGGQGPRPENIDVVFQPIRQALQQIVRANSERDVSRPPAATPSLNIFRVFRMVTPPSAPTSPTSLSPEASDHTGDPTPRPENQGETSNGRQERNVTIVVVALHSALTDTLSSAFPNITTPSPALEPSVNLPPLNETPTPAQGNLTDSPRHITRRSRFTHLHRASHHVSPANLGWLQARNGSQRRPVLSPPNEGAHDDDLNTATVTPPNDEDSPPGPIPPPSTPAEHNLSAVSSQPASPSRRQSTVSSMHYPVLTEEDDPAEATPQERSVRTNERTLRSARHRRRSESDSARYPHFGAGSARRNGVVEPDSVEEGDERTGRNWLIYVVGTNVSGDHPAWTTPSLFSDNPTYEDMLMLSSLLGPAKPPVASSQDVAAAGGIFRVVESESCPVAQSLSDSSTIPVIRTERCLICLEEYQVNEHIRQLAKCAHLFHRTCIDEWLTTGRNSCPLCREEGVTEEKFPRGADTSNTSTDHSQRQLSDVVTAL